MDYFLIETNFSIDLVPGVIPVSRDLYRMIVPELLYLKMQPQELVDKGYIIRKCITMGSSDVI